MWRNIKAKADVHEAWRAKKNKRKPINEQKRNVGHCVNKSNICVTGKLQEGKRCVEIMFEELSHDFSKSDDRHYSINQELQLIPNQIDTKNTTSRYIIFELPNMKDKILIAVEPGMQFVVAMVTFCSMGGGSEWGLNAFCTSLSSIFLVNTQRCPWRIICDLVQSLFVSESPKGFYSISYLPAHFGWTITHLFGLYSYGLAWWKN